MANPSIPGPHTFQRIVYAATGLNYPNSLNQYQLFEAPTAGFETRHIDISPFAELGFSTPWPFTDTQAPINGIAWITSAEGAVPLVLVAHGNHNPFENSTPGYEYLGQHLASHGIIAASIDVNFLNGRNFGENDGRAIVHLEHIRQFLNWNDDPSHELFGRIDPERIMIVGHSRGGEAVGHVSLFNRLVQIQPDLSTPPVLLDGSAGLGPYQFEIGGVIAIAPTDRQYIPITGPTRVRDNYYVFHGSRDNDVINFPGYRTYDRSHAVDLSNPVDPPEGFKGLLWIHRANHNFFNSIWQQEASAPTLTRSQQEQIAVTAVTAMSGAVFNGDLGCLQFIQDHQKGQQAGWLPAGVTLVSQYHDLQRILIQHSEEPGPNLVISQPVSGSIDITEVAATKHFFQLGSSSHLFQESSGVRLDWQTSFRRYVVNIDPMSVAIDAFGWIGMRIGQSFESNNVAGQEQDFSIVFHDTTMSVAIKGSTVQRLFFPDQFSQIQTEPKTVMQTFRIALSELRQAGLNTRHLRRISLVFDRRPSGTLYLDDILVSN